MLADITVFFCPAAMLNVCVTYLRSCLHLARTFTGWKLLVRFWPSGFGSGLNEDSAGGFHWPVPLLSETRVECG